MRKIIILLIIESLTFLALGKTPFRIAQKDLVINKLKSIYIFKDNGISSFQKSIKKHIIEQPVIFGDPCDPYETLFIHDQEIPSGATSEYFVPTNPETLCQSRAHAGIRLQLFPSPGRLATISNLCLDLNLKSDEFIKNFQQNICQSENCSFNAKNIVIAYSLFHPTEQLTIDLANELFNSLNKNNNLESFRDLSLALCLDPNWQLL